MNIILSYLFVVHSLVFLRCICKCTFECKAYTSIVKDCFALILVICVEHFVLLLGSYGSQVRRDKIWGWWEWIISRS